MENLNDYPSICPSLLLDFANSQQLDPRIEFTRNTIATRINSRGLLEVVPANVPRIDYDPVTLACLGLLAEGQGANLMVRSEFPGGLSDALTGGGVSAGAIAGFTGALSVQLAASESYVYKSVSHTQGNPYSFSFFVQMDDGGAPVVSDSSTAGDLCVIYAGGFVSLSVTKVQHIPALGVYRVSVSQPTPNAETNFGVVKYAGQSARGFKVTGYQLETGLLTKSYIPTEDTSLTRAADVAQMTGVNFASWYRQDEGTLFLEAAPSDISGVDKYWASFESSGAGPAVDGISIRSYGGGVVCMVAAQSVIEPQIVLPIAIAAESRNKIAFAFKKGSSAAAKNGEPLRAVNTPKTPSGLNSLNIMPSMSGHIERIAYYPQRLTNEQLQRLTA